MHQVRNKLGTTLLWNRLTAFCALLFAGGSLFVAYESMKITKDFNEIMLDYYRRSSKPTLQILRNSQYEVPPNGLVTGLFLVNTGIGPAEVGRTYYFCNGEEIREHVGDDGEVEKVEEVFLRALTTLHPNKNLKSNFPPSPTLDPDEKFFLLGVPGLPEGEWKEWNDYEDKMKKTCGFHIRYESNYGEYFQFKWGALEKQTKSVK